MMKKRFMLLAFLLCGYLTVYSQVSLSGIVYDENGKALTGANVILVETSVGTITDAKGEFFFSFLQTGNYQLKVSFIGYGTVLQSVDLQKDTKLSVSLKLMPFLTDEVIVTAIRAAENAPVTKSNFSKEEIRKQSTGQDVPYLLGLTPSVVTSSDAGTGIGYSAMRIRGTDMSGINVTVNGIPFNDAESHGVYWVDMPDISTSADNIQIQRGVGSSTQGAGAFGGTINFQTSTLKTNPYADINTSFGSFNTLKNSISFGTGLLNNHFTIDGRLSRITSDGYIDRGWSNLKSYYLAGAWYNKHSLLKLITFSGLEHTYQAWNGVPSDSLKSSRTFNSLGMYYDKDGVMHYYPNQTDNYQQDNYQLLFSHQFTESLSMNAALHFTKGKGYYEEYKSGENLEDYQLANIITPKEDTISVTDLIRRKWLDNAFYGGTWSLNYTTKALNASFGGGLNQYFGKHYGTVIWAQYMSNGLFDHQYYYNSGTKNDFNIFGKMSYNLNDAFSIYIDLQYRVITHDLRGLGDNNIESITQNHTYNFYNPKFGFTYKIDKLQNLYCYFGIANREPTRDNFVNADINNPMRSEKLKDFEIGYNFKSDNIKFGLNGYYMAYTDQLIQTGKINDVGAAIFTNVPESYRSGLEATFQARLSKKLTWDVNFTASKNIIKQYVSYTDNWDTWLQDSVILKNKQIAFSPSFIGSSQIRYEIIPQLSISLQSKLVGKQFIDNTQDDSRKLDKYFLNDLQVNYHLKTKFFSSIDFVIKLNNIFDQKYINNAWIYPYYEENKLKVMDGYFPQAGRNIMTSITLSF